MTTRPEAYEQELRDTVRAYQDSGLRATVALDIRDRAFFTYQDDAEFLESLPPELRQRALAAFPVRRTPDVDAVVGLLPELRRHADPARVRFALGPQAPQWCTMETLQRARAAARELGCGLHLHCAETEAQLAYFLHAHRKTPVRFLHDLGLLGSDVSLAHCVWLSPEDIQLLAASGTIVVHNPSSNLRLRSGIAPVAELLRAGVAVALGTDSLTLDESHDLFHEMRLAARLQALPGRGGATIEPHRWLAAATVAGARAALRPERLGSIRAGYKADLVLLDRRALEEPFTANLPERLADVVFFRARGAHVRAVIVGGQVVIENGRFVHVDPQTLAEQIAEHAATFRPDPARRELLALLKRRVQAYLEHLAPAYAD